MADCGFPQSAINSHINHCTLSRKKQTHLSIRHHIFFLITSYAFWIIVSTDQYYTKAFSRIESSSTHLIRISALDLRR
jgi:hypothetical protein